MISDFRGLVNQNHDFIDGLADQGRDGGTLVRVTNGQQHQELLDGGPTEKLAKGWAAVERGASQGDESGVVNGSDEQACDKS